MFLFFAGINNNANAQKEPPITMLHISYVWHCAQPSDILLGVHFNGNTQNNGYQSHYYQFDELQPVVNSHEKYTNVTVDVDVRGNFAFGHVTKTVSEFPYVQRIDVTVDIYDSPQMVPGW